MAIEHDDTPEYLREWAGKLAEACTGAELRTLYDGYRQLANNKRLPKAERTQARRRASAVKKFL